MIQQMKWGIFIVQSITHTLRRSWCVSSSSGRKSLMKFAYAILEQVGTLSLGIKNVALVPGACLDGILDLRTPSVYCPSSLGKRRYAI